MKTLESIDRWFTEAVPEPTDKSRSVQVGCHLEEAAEMLEAIGSPGALEVHRIANYFKREGSIGANDVARMSLLDSLCDQIVTAVGVAHMFNLDILGALAEVDRSNWSKFVDGKPMFNEHGKIAKPDTYSPPDLMAYTIGKPIGTLIAQHETADLPLTANVQGAAWGTDSLDAAAAAVVQMSAAITGDGTGTALPDAENTERTGEATQAAE